jgi:hypothetical protein
MNIFPSHRYKKIFRSLIYLFSHKRFLTIKSQNDGEESKLLNDLAPYLEKKSFIEFGFDIGEFNSVPLISHGFKGLLIESWHVEVHLFNLIAKTHKLKTKALNCFLTLDDIEPIELFVKANQGLGVLSVDIDGNDYWILLEILKIVNPEVIIVEYNASFLDYSITVPYDKDFDISKQQSPIYHGASLMAFYNLLSVKNYRLVANTNGINLFFIKKELADKANMKSYKGMEIYKENKLRNDGNTTNAKDQWATIKNLEYIEV